ncbi:MAG TPA: caspase family protein [Thermoanaerobaculia bacterium]|nr:caspase family protein [Thermoanaerobaculia bacterium]
MPAVRHALLIGINQYPKIPNANLQGCVSDMELMRSLLIDRFGFPPESTRTLRDEEATQAGIRGALAEIAAAVGEEDLVVLFYAGHGSRMADPRQPGRMIESIVTHDSGRGTLPNLDILDEEVDQWVQKVNEKTPRVTLIFDCCHSGSVTRDPFGDATREAPADLRAPAEMFAGGQVPEIFSTSRAADAEEKGPAGWLPGRRRAVVIAACRADEYANEHKALTGAAVVRHGALTFFLGQALAQVQPGATWRDVFEQVAPVLTSKYGRQHPQLEGRMDQLLFGTEEIRPASYLQILSVGKDAVELAGGAAHGLRSGSLWTVRSPGARHVDAGDELAVVEVQTVQAATSTARVIEARRQRGGLAAGRAFLREQRLPEPGLRMAIEAPAEPWGRLAVALAGEPLLRVVEGAGEADVLIRHIEPSTWVTLGRDGRFAARPRPDQPDELRGLIGDLLGIGRYRQLLDLDNPDPASRLKGRVTLRAQRWLPDQKALADAVPEAGAGVPVFCEGERAEFEIVNRHDAAVWVSVVEFGCDGKIALLLPRPGHATYARGGVRLEPGQTFRMAADYYRQDPSFAEAVRNGLPLQLPEGFPWAAEPGETVDLGLLTLKLLVTPTSADFEFLEQAAVRDTVRVGPHPLEQLALLYCAGHGTRSFCPKPSDTAPEMDWATATLPIGVRR